MTMTGLQIFKFLPAAGKAENANCKKCGCPTCMMFAIKLAKNQIQANKCPFISNELKNKFETDAIPPQKTIHIGNLKIGGEKVLYRHEKTFVNPTALAITVNCQNNDYLKKIKQIQNFSINILGEKIGIDLIILKNYPLNSISNEIKIPSNSTEIMTYEQFCNSGLTIIEDDDFQVTKNYLINTRKRAVINKDEECSSPVCVVMKTQNNNIADLCAKASFYICKYANALIFEDFDEELLSTLITLRQNIFTNPQQNLQVEEGLYKFNNPDKNSIVFMTTNFALTFYAVANELESLDVPSYLIILPAKGMSVLTAWSAQTFTPNIVEHILNEFNIRQQISTRKIIIPGLVSSMKEELNKACPDFEFIEGTHEASDIKNFVYNLLKNKDA